MSPFHLLFAQTAAATPGSSLAQTIFLFGSLGLIWYFLLIRPQQKQKKDQERSLHGLSKGDTVVTAGGLVGEVLHIKDGVKDGAPAKTMEDHVTIRSGESKLVVHRGRIAQVLRRNAGE
jgi:preprotein translocase subunit YajC